MRDAIGTEILGGGTGCIGTPAQIRASLQGFADAGVDQTVFIQQSGRTLHRHICESLELFAAEVMPDFKRQEAEREATKREALAPFVAAAFARKQTMQPLADEQIPTHSAYALSAPPVDISTLPEGNRRRALAMRKMREIAERS